MKEYQLNDPMTKEYFKKDADSPWTQHKRMFIDLSVTEFYEEFFGDDAAYSIADLAAAQKYTPKTLHPWKKKE